MKLVSLSNKEYCHSVQSWKAQKILSQSFCQTQCTLKPKLKYRLETIAFHLIQLCCSFQQIQKTCGKGRPASLEVKREREREKEGDSLRFEFSSVEVK